MSDSPGPGPEVRPIENLDRPRSGPKGSYPWDSWLRTDGSAVILRPDRDYTSKTSSFRQMAYNAARKRGLVAHVLSQRDGSIALYAVPIEDRDEG